MSPLEEDGPPFPARRARIAVWIGLGLIFSTAGVRAQTPAQLPMRTIDAREPAVAKPGVTVVLHDGGNLQLALDRASPGDTLALDPDAIFQGPFTLPRKRGEGWITIRSSGAIPSAGTRVAPADAAQMPKLVASRGPAIVAAAGANHYRFVGIEVRPGAGEFVHDLVELGANAMPTADLPHDFVFARCYLHGDPLFGARRGIVLNAGATAIVDSYLADFKEQGADSQAIAGWSGTGPFLIANNYLEGAGENLLFGGADPPSADRVPSDIEIRGNLFSKPLSWKAGTPGFTGEAWSVKNLLELKDARRVLIEGNVFERNWLQSQNGFAILFTVRNQDGTAPWSVVEDITFAGNLVRDVGSGINILGRDNSHGDRSEQTRRIDIRDNRFENIGGAEWGGSGTLFQILEGTSDVDIEHNTAFQSGNVIMSEGPPNTGFVFRHNIVMHNAYGITGSGAGVGTLALTTYFPGAVVDGNVFIGGEAARYPSGNQFATSLDAVFADAKHRRVRAPYSGAGATPNADP